MASSTVSLWPRIVLIGDSLTQFSFSHAGGWAALLQDSLARRADVVARGLSGYNSRNWTALCRRLPPRELRGDVATLWLGANDASTSVQQGVPVAEYAGNLATIVDHVMGPCGVRRVVVLTPPPADEAAMVTEWQAVRSGALTAQYAAACAEFAHRRGLPCVDLHAAFLKQSSWQSLLCDGLHLSRAGAELVHAELLPVLQEQLSAVLPTGFTDTVDVILPLWGDLDPNNTDVQIDNWTNKHKPRAGNT